MTKMVGVHNQNQRLAAQNEPVAPSTSAVIQRSLQINSRTDYATGEQIIEALGELPKDFHLCEVSTSASFGILVAEIEEHQPMFDTHLDQHKLKYVFKDSFQVLRGNEKRNRVYISKLAKCLFFQPI